MKLVYLHSDQPSVAAMSYVATGDFLVNLSHNEISFYGVRTSNEGQIIFQLLDKEKCQENGLPSPYILFNYDQVNKRDGNASSISILANALTSPIVKLLLQNFIDILLYRKDAIDLTIIEQLYSNPKQDPKPIISSMDLYVFPKYLSGNTLAIYERRTSQGETNLRPIYEEIKIKYPTEYRKAIDLFRRDYPNDNIYLKQQNTTNRTSTQIDINFIFDALKEHGFVTLDGDNTKWRSPDGSSYSISISKIPKIKVVEKSKEEVKPLEKPKLTEIKKESIIGAQVYNIRNLTWGLGKVMDEIDVDGTTYISVRHQFFEEEQLYAYPKAIKNDLISIVPEYVNPYEGDINSAQFTELMRQKYKRYRKPWEKNEDNELKKFITRKVHPRIIAEKIGRTESSIINRIIDLKILK